MGPFNPQTDKGTNISVTNIQRVLNRFLCGSRCAENLIN
jgi:hypothetical protein